MELGDDGKLVHFADDLALVTTARRADALVGLVNRSLHAVDTCLRDKKLELTPYKTVIVLLTGRESRN